MLATRVPQGAIINVLWRSEYQTKACQTVSIMIRDNSGPWTVLATNVKNHGAYRVTLPHQAMSQAQIKLASEQGNFFDLSERFIVT